MERKLHKKCGVFEACKKVTDFFDTLMNPREINDFTGIRHEKGGRRFCVKAEQIPSLDAPLKKVEMC